MNEENQNTIYKIVFYNPQIKKWVDWKNAYSNIVYDTEKERLEKQFKATESFKTYNLKYKIKEVLK